MMFKYRTNFTKQDGSMVPTWSLMPISKECPFVEAMYNPDDKSLNILIDSTKEYFRDQAIKTEKGDYIKNKDGSFKTRSVRYDQYYEHHLTDARDIELFMKNYVINNFPEEVVEDKKLEEKVVA